MNSITLRNSGFGRIFILPNVFDDKRLFETSFLERQNEHECSRNFFFLTAGKMEVKNKERRRACHLAEKSGWGVESIIVSDLPVYRRIAISVTV